MAKRKLPESEKLQSEIIFKRNLQRLRLEQAPPVNITDTAKNLEISVAYYHALEDKDRHTKPTFKMLEKIASYYKISVWELFL